MTDRRAFLRMIGTAVATAGVTRPAQGAQAAPAQKPSTGIRKSVLLTMLPKELSFADRFTLAREVGFEAIEIGTVYKDEEAAEIREAAQKAGLRIHSVMNEAHWRKPLSSADPAVVKESVQGVETSLKNAKLWGADTVLVVPAVVNATTSYRDAYTRSQRVIKEQILPAARDMKVTIAVEEVWNKFLLSPIEFARYVDELDSPWARAYFDVGNVVLYAFPQDWIRTLGSRIVKIHLKDFSWEGRNGRFAWKNIGEGDIDWPEVRRALSDVGYTGFVTTELKDGDSAYLKDVSVRVDRFLAGEKPVA